MDSTPYIGPARTPSPNPGISAITKLGPAAVAQQTQRVTLQDWFKDMSGSPFVLMKAHPAEQGLKALTLQTAPASCAADREVDPVRDLTLLRGSTQEIDFAEQNPAVNTTAPSLSQLNCHTIPLLHCQDSRGADRETAAVHNYCAGQHAIA
jgi:hypothetical protein